MSALETAQAISTHLKTIPEVFHGEIQSDYGMRITALELTHAIRESASREADLDLQIGKYDVATVLRKASAADFAQKHGDHTLAVRLQEIFEGDFTISVRGTPSVMEWMGKDSVLVATVLASGIELSVSQRRIDIHIESNPMDIETHFAQKRMLELSEELRAQLAEEILGIIFTQLQEDYPQPQVV